MIAPRRLPIWICAALVAALSPGLAPAQPGPAKGAKKPAAAAAGAPQDDALKAAKDLFKKGVELASAGDYERALDYFLRSRTAYPSAQNTTNAALCLDKLQRYDEALEMYEDLITRFSAELGSADRAAVAPAMAALRGKVGNVDVSANVTGTVVVDGRPRGKLPLTSAVRVQPGTRTVRVLKDGYVTREVSVRVDAGQRVGVDLKLEPLAAAGLARVEVPESPGLEVFVDRVNVGVTPWESTLGVGKHVVWAQKGDVGTPPTAVQIVQAQTALLRLKALPLGAALRVDVPGTADVAVDGVSIGSGTWEGRLPEGEHEITVSEDGYRAQSRKVRSAADAGPATLKFDLEIDPDHPRWPSARRGSFWVGVFGGYGIMPSLGSGAEARCAAGACTRQGLGGGLVVGARAGYRLSFGLAVELGGGFVRLTKPVSRKETERFGNGAHTATYALDDELRLLGPLVLAGLSYRLGIGATFGLLGRIQGGALFASSSDVMTGKGTGGGETVALTVARSGQVARSAAAVVMPELGVDLAFGHLRVGALVGVLAILTDGPTLPNGPISVPFAQCPRDTNPGAVSCAPRSTVASGEKGFGRSVVVTPQLTVGYAF